MATVGSLALALGMAVSAQANLTGSTFEGSDGNLVVTTAGNTDWANVAGLAQGDDIVSKTADNAFGQGTKEDISNVTIVDGSIPPNKNNLSRFYEADEQVANGDVMLYLAWERLVNIGNANLDFEISQNPTEGWTQDTTGPLTIIRTAGDLLVTYDFSGQGTPTLGLNTWLTAAAGDTVSDCYSANALPCWGKHVTLKGDNSEGAVNTDTVAEPIAGGDLTAGLFGEAAINLTAAGVFQPGVCKAFGSAFVKSRSSSSFTAELKDFIAPIGVSISNCSSITIAKKTENAPTGDSTSFSYTTTGTDLSDFSLTSGGSTTFNELQAGSYTVTEGTLPDNWKLKSLTCDTGTWAVSGSKVTISLKLEENVTCTFTNHYTNTPSISTTLSDTTILLGGTVHDSATLTGASTTAGGSVTYTVYTDSACTLNPKVAGTKTVTNGTVPDSDLVTFNTAGDYYWQAAYSGDDNNKSATSACTDEHLVVKTAPTIGTVLQTSEMIVGNTVYDTATLTNVTSDAGGTVTYHAYAGQNTCTGTDLLNDTVTVTNGLVPNSKTITPSAAGWYSFQAVYSGDARNDTATSVCSTEQLLVMNQPSISTTLSATSIVVGGAVHDSSTLTGATGTAGGTVKYTVYTDSACTLGATDAGTKTVTNGGVPDSDAVTFTTAGDYYWQAFYSGDTFNKPATSTCLDEHLIVQTAPTIETVLQPDVINLGQSAFDTASLHGVTSDAGGTVIYHAYLGQNICSGTDLLNDTVTVENGQVPNSESITPQEAGYYSFQAVYSGDAYNDGATSVCSTEQLLVKTNPSISTTLSKTSIVVGGAVHDSSSLTGATPTAGGTVQYTVYSDSACTLNAVDAGLKPVTNGLVADSNSITFNTPGNYYWQAYYSGDLFNNPATSNCMDEHLVVQTAPTIGTLLQHDVISAGDTMYDTASLTGVTPDAGGTVTYHAYAGKNTCTGTDLLDSTVNVTNGIVPNSKTITLDQAGYYSFQAVYSGDLMNAGATSACETEQLLVKTNPTISTALSDTSVVVDSYVYDSATLFGVTDTAGGTVTYTVYTDSACTLNPRDAGTTTVTNGVAPPSNPVQFMTPGDYYWQAVYSGDTENNGATSVCTEEHLVVIKAPSSLTSGQALRPQDSVAVTATAGGMPTGSVTFSLYKGACTGDPAYTETVDLSGAATAVTNNQSFIIPAANADRYNWLVSYSGDDLHQAIKGSCGSENFVLTIDNGGAVGSE